MMRHLQESLAAFLALCGLSFSIASGEAMVKPVPSEPTSTVHTVASESDAFSLELYARLDGGEGNLFFSPYSIDSALAMTYAGARGQTAAQMAQALHFSLPPDQLHAAFGQLIADLNAGGIVEGKPAYELAVANALWGQKGFAYQPAFLDLVGKSYSAGLHQVDFAHAAEPARLEINSWVEDQTKKKIKDLFEPGTIDASTKLVLANAIYFKGSWVRPFNRNQTQNQPFQAPGGKSIQTPMMFQQGKLPYAENDDLQAVELPYAGDKLSMVVLLPRKADGLAALEKTLTSAKVNEWISQMNSHRDVKLFLPRFKMEQTLQLASVLEEMGMTDAFSPAADFSGIATGERLMIDKVIHKAFVDVNEEGTEAAGATGVIMRPTAMRREEPPAVFRADHPFLFLIRHRDSGAILFLGRLMEPKV